MRQNNELIEVFGSILVLISPCLIWIFAIKIMGMLFIVRICKKCKARVNFFSDDERCPHCGQGNSYMCKKCGAVDSYKEIFYESDYAYVNGVKVLKNINRGEYKCSGCGNQGCDEWVDGTHISFIKYACTCISYQERP